MWARGSGRSSFVSVSGYLSGLDAPIFSPVHLHGSCCHWEASEYASHDMDQITGWRVAHKLEKKKLLIAINCVAALSIFFFGYDQGMMGGVNNATDYINLMGFGYVNEEGDPVVTDSLLQGGIVS